MENLFMSASVVITIVLCLVGIIKSFFKNFKEKYPKAYKAVFTTLAFLLSIILSIINELYILNGKLLSIDFAILICVVLAGVFGSYSGIYDVLGVKTLFSKIVENIKIAKNIASNEKAIQYLNKIEDIDGAIKILEERQKAEAEKIEQEKNETIDSIDYEHEI